jgi:hypothetical protein
MKNHRLRPRKPRLTAVGIRCLGHETPLYPQKLALISPTSGDRLVGIFRLRAKGHGVCCFVLRSVNLLLAWSFAVAYISEPCVMDAYEYEVGRKNRSSLQYTVSILFLRLP